jgi:hypothetical protein
VTEQPERELEEMQERAEKLEDQIDEVREDWERKKADSSVPGAVGEPDESEDDVEIDPRDPANEDL